MIRNKLFRFVFTLAALAVLILYIFGPLEMAERFDTMALGLLGLAALPWLGALVEEFKIGGVEAKLRNIEEKIDEAQDAASDAREVAEELAVARVIPPEFEDLLKREFRVQPSDFGMPAAPEPLGEAVGDMTKEPVETAREVSDMLMDLKRISESYMAVRRTMKSGAVRTARMTNIFADMQAVARELGGDHKGILAWLHSDDDGKQLAVIAWLRNFPAATAVSNYIQLIEDAKQPFVEYWGLRALAGRLSAVGLDEISISDRIRLKELESSMRAGTDRHVQIRRINRKIEGRTPVE